MSKTARILIVDDDRDILEVYSKILACEGYEVWTAATGQQALQLAREALPEIVLLDLMLPDLSGLEVCRQLRREPGLSELSVVLFSGYATTGADKLQGAEDGADDYLVKPVGREELLARIRTLVRLRNANAALRASERHYRQLIEILPDGVMSVDWDGRLVSVNPQALCIFGFGSAAEMLQRTLFDLISPGEHPQLRRNIAATVEKGSPFKSEHQGAKADGAPLSVELNLMLSLDQRGHPAGLVAVLRDITESRRNEEQIRLLADAVHGAPQYISVTDRENRFIFVNQAFLKAYGYGEDEVLGRTPEFLGSALNPSDLTELIHHRTLAGGWKGELLNRRKDGSEFPLFLSTSLIKNDAGHGIGMLGVARNISDEKRNARQIAAFSQLGSRLSGAVGVEEAAHVIMEIASDLFGWDCGYIDTFSPGTNEIVHVLVFDIVDGQRQRMPSVNRLEPTPLTLLVLKEGARLINSGEDPHSSASGIPFGNMNRRSACRMYVPIRSRGAVVGLLSIQSYTPGAYSPRDLEVLQALADHCGNALRRIRLRHELSAAEANYRGIVENATEGIYRSSLEGKIIDVNPAMARIYGYTSPAEMIALAGDLGRDLHVRPESRDEVVRLLAGQGSVHGLEIETKRKDGTRIWVSLNARMVPNAAGEVLYYQGTIQDITQRKSAQQRLADAMELNLTILGSSTVGIVAYRPSGQCIFANAAAAGIVGGSPEQLMLQNFRHLPSWENYGVLRMAEEVLRDREARLKELCFVSSFGREAWVECRMAPFTSSSEVHLLVLMIEITKRKEIEEELRTLPRRIIEAQEMERMRVARELHDSVNQLIASVQMRLRRVEEKVASTSPSAGEILARCRDLLVRALEENRRIAHDLRPTDLDQLGFAVACANFCREFGTRTNTTVGCRIARFEHRLPPVAELNLFRIVQEALNNAHKHARAKRVQLNVSLHAGSVQLKIRDEGCGFDPSRIEGKKGKGKGIGLTNIRERATLLGGKCTIQSKPGKGTTITICVPCAAAGKADGGSGCP